MEEEEEIVVGTRRTRRKRQSPLMRASGRERRRDEWARIRVVGGEACEEEQHTFDAPDLPGEPSQS